MTRDLLLFLLLSNVSERKGCTVDKIASVKVIMSRCMVWQDTRWPSRCTIVETDDAFLLYFFCCVIMMSFFPDDEKNTPRWWCATTEKRYADMDGRRMHADGTIGRGYTRRSFSYARRAWCRLLMSQLFTPTWKDIIIPCLQEHLPVYAYNVFSPPDVKRFGGTCSREFSLESRQRRHHIIGCLLSPSHTRHIRRLMATACGRYSYVTIVLLLFWASFWEKENHIL